MKTIKGTRLRNSGGFEFGSDFGISSALIKVVSLILLARPMASDLRKLGLGNEWMREGPVAAN